MAANSKIEWTDVTWNPVSGCTKVSTGCDHRYADKITERFHGKGSFEQVQLHPDRLDKPFSWRKPRRVFVNSMSDLFHEQVPDEFIARVWAIMALTPQHTYQCLTKRHGRMRSLLRSPRWTARVPSALIRVMNGTTRLPPAHVVDQAHAWATAPEWVGDQLAPLPNVHLGVSVEDQKRADIRIPALLDTPAAVRFLSCEPLLGPVDLGNCASVDALNPDWAGNSTAGTGCLHPLIDWVIVGGESGPGARPMHPDWARRIRDDVAKSDAGFFFKQWGEWVPVGEKSSRDVRESDWHVKADGYAWPLDQPHGVADGTEVLIRRAGKHNTGRELDGRTWSEYPAVAR